MLSSVGTGLDYQSMNTLFLDIESFSTVPIERGTYRYAEGAELLMAQMATNDGDVHVVDATLHGPDVVLHQIQEAAEQADIIVAHNAEFETTLLRRFGLELPQPKMWCTKAQALAHSLPGGLDKLCTILGVPHDEAKGKEGKALIQRFCKPRGAREKLRRHDRITHPDEWARFIEYARLDVIAMRAVRRKLPTWNYGPAERELWRLDQRINARGFRVDIDLATKAVESAKRIQRDLAGKTAVLTDGDVGRTTQRDKLLAHIASRYGIQIDDLRGATIDTLLDDETLDDGVRILLKIRQQATTSSTAKYHRLLHCVSADGRLRGTLQFCGAMRTGRWSGRLFQPQNLPRPSRKAAQVLEGIEWIKADGVDVMYDDPMQVLSDALRGVILGPLTSVDYSNIEGRVLAWLAGETWKLQAFRDFDAGIGADLYIRTYAAAFGVPYADAKRQIGKAMELAMGYAGGIGAFLSIAAIYHMDIAELARAVLASAPRQVIDRALGWYGKTTERYGLTRDEFVACDTLKLLWRAAHPATTSLWYRLEDAFREVTLHEGEVSVGRLVLARGRGSKWVRMILPSGRALSYPLARVADNGDLSFAGVKQPSRKWGRIPTYGGKLAENATQAVARDVMAVGMLNADAAGMRLILTVHDDVIVEGECLDALRAAMLDMPPIYAGLPLAAAGFTASRFGKYD